MAHRYQVLYTKDAADYLKVSSRMLERWRSEGDGPRFHKMGRRGIRYRLCDLNEFLETQASDANENGGAE